MDSAECIVDLWETVKRFVQIKNIRPEFFSEWENGTMFYNNFELSKVSFWYSEAYQTYVDYIDKAGGIYYNRWGDAPIKSIGLSLFMPEKKIHHFNDIGYHHQGYYNQTHVNIWIRFSRAIW